MLAIFGEDRSDTDTLRVLVRRLAGSPTLSVKSKSYGSCGELVRKVTADLKAQQRLGCNRFVVCYDADGPDPAARHEQMRQIVRRSGVEPCCVVIPVEEIEAWILADVQAVTKVFSGWSPQPKPIDNPETIPNPKEYLIRLSRGLNRKPRYDHVNDNPRVAEHLDLTRVTRLCPSFRPLAAFIAGQGT